MKSYTSSLGSWSHSSRLCLLLMAFFYLTQVSLGQSTNDLWGHWTFDDGTAKDTSSNNRASTANGTLKVVPGRFGQALEFDGLANYIQSEIVPWMSNVTGCAWIKIPADFSADSHIIGRWDNGENFVLQVDVLNGQPFLSAGFHDYSLQAGALPEIWINDLVPIAFDTWYFAAATYDGSTLRLYKDQHLVAQRSTDKNKPYGGSIPTAIPTMIGAQRPGQLLFKGIIDDARLYSRALSADELQKVRLPLWLATQPTNQLTLSGNTVYFAVIAEGMPPFTIQWLHNRDPIPGATNQTLWITNVTEGDTGTYSALISNPASFLESSRAFLALVTPGVDDDGDGIPTETELSLELDPLNPDTDGDWVSDYDEIYRWNSDPKQKDSDSDGIPDDWEALHGMNPRAKDAESEAAFSGLTFREIYDFNLTHTNRIDPQNPFGGPIEIPAWELVHGTQQTNRFFYDRNDRLIGVESSRGVSMGYAYDGNGNLVRQAVLSRQAESNGLPVLWRFINGLSNNASAFSDSDGDGWSNFQECKAGTHPTNILSAPNLIGNPGVVIGRLDLPFTPTNFVVAVGQLDGAGAEEIVIGADGETGTNANWLVVLTQTAMGWRSERVDVGSAGVTSLAVGWVTNRPGPAIYAGLRQSNGVGQVIEILGTNGVWSSSIVAVSTNDCAFVLGVNGRDLLMSFDTETAEGGLIAAGFTTNWDYSLLRPESSKRGLGSMEKRNESPLVLRLLDSGGIEVGAYGLGSKLLAYYPLDGNANDTSTGNQHATVLGASFVSDRFGNPSSACDMANGNYLIVNPFAGFPSEELTVALWMKSSDQTHSGVPFSYAVAEDANELVLDDYRNLGISIRGGGSTSFGLSANDGAWHHLSLTWRRSDGQFRFFRDGVLVKEGVLSQGLSLRTTGVLVLGQEQDSLGGGFEEYQSFIGVLDDVVILGRALSTNEANELYLSRDFPFSKSSTLIAEPPIRRAKTWSGCSVEAGAIRGTNGTGVFFTCIDDVNTNGLADFGDAYVVAEYLVRGTNADLLTLSRQPITSFSPAQSYGLASVDLLNSGKEVFITGEPDGLVFAWTADSATNALERRLFSGHHAGKAWHAMTGVRTLDAGEGLIGLRVAPADSNACDVVFWAPQTELPSLANVVQTPPSSIVLPSSASLGSLGTIIVRLWDGEGNSATPFLQFRTIGETNWHDVTIIGVDGAMWSNGARFLALPSGSDHVVTWNVAADLGAGIATNVLLRTRASDVSLIGEWSVPTPFAVAVPLDNDALPDAWEVLFFGTTSRDGTGDFDGDGASDFSEFLAGTLPNDPNSKLALSITRQDDRILLRWQAGTNGPIYLQRRFGLDETGQAWEDILTNLPSPGNSSYTNILNTGEVGIYRLRVQ